MSQNLTDPQACVLALLEFLDDDDRELLKRGSVLRFITRDSAIAATTSPEAADRLLENPLLRKVSWGSANAQEIWEIPMDIRSALLSDSDSASEQIRSSVAQGFSTTALSLDSLYTRLSTKEYAAAARAQLKQHFDDLLAQSEPNIARAYDLTVLLTEWPINQDAESQALYHGLSPKLNRYARAGRDFEATSKYLERSFERTAFEMLKSDSPQWMMQVYAPGGRGKTMFLRNLIGRYCPANDTPVARIDFDFLEHLTLVTQQPWRILLTIARQLNDQLAYEPFGYMLSSWGEYEARLSTQTSTAGTLAAPQEMLSGGSAADEVRKRFASELADAAKDRPVVIVLDTFENVLHSVGASLQPLLCLLNEIRTGEISGNHIPAVPGLRVMLCGRFDLEIHPDAFGENWVGPTKDVVTKDVGGGSKARIGKAIISIELKDFSQAEAREYLVNKCKLDDQNKIDAILNRCHLVDADGIRRSNPMTLALIAEHIQENPEIQASDITAFKSIELYYLIDRVVDRIADGRVQWLLRWGVLPNVLTKELVEAIIWPALVKFVEERSNYDDAIDNSLDAPRHKNARWAPLAVEQINSPGDIADAWQGLLQYAAKASWVSIRQEMPNAVVFHPEVRDPLRQLLKDKNDLVYHDIHAKSFQYWQDRISRTSGSELSMVLSSVMYHAYQPWSEDGAIRRNAGQLLRRLLLQFVDNRQARRDLAEEVLKAFELSKSSNSLAPSFDEQLCAHLELAEFHVVDVVTNGVSLNEAIVATHLSAAKTALAQRSTDDLAKSLVSADSREIQRVLDDERRRVDLLSVVQLIAMNRLDDAWSAFGELLPRRKPEQPDQVAHFQLVVDVATTMDTRANSPSIAKRLVKLAQGTPEASKALSVLARCLISEEKWTEALRIVRQAHDKAGEAKVLLQLGRAKEVESNPEFPSIYRAEAALQLLLPTQALGHLKNEERQGSQNLCIKAQAYLLTQDYSQAKSLLSAAMTEQREGFDLSYASEAWLCLCRVLIDEGNYGQANSELNRLFFREAGLPKRIQSFAYRAEALTALVDYYLTDDDLPLQTGTSKRPYEVALEDLRQRVLAERSLPPSVLVHVELARLEISGATNDRLDDFAYALVCLDHPKTRLLVLRNLSRVSRVAGEQAPQRQVSSDLEEMCRIKADQPALKLGLAELYRVLGRDELCRQLIDGIISSADPQADQFTVALTKRFMPSEEMEVASAADDGPEFSSPTELTFESTYFENSKTILFEIEQTKSGDLEVQARLSRSDSEEFGSPSRVFEKSDESHFRLAKNPTEFLDELGQAMMWDQLEDLRRNASSVVVELEAYDEPSARIPWELASTGSFRASDEVDAIVRTIRQRSTTTEKIVNSAAVCVVNVADSSTKSSATKSSSSKSRTQAFQQAGLGNISKTYDRFTNAAINSLGSADIEEFVSFGKESRVVHFVSLMENRRQRALTSIGTDSVTAETIVHLFADGGPKLIIFDLLFSHSEVDAAEQLMLANTLFWSIAQSAPNLSIIGGVFGTDTQRQASLDRLIKGLSDGEPLIEIAGALQQLKTGRAMHPLRTAVSLWSATPGIAFRLKAST